MKQYKVGVIVHRGADNAVIASLDDVEKDDGKIYSKTPLGYLVLRADDSVVASASGATAARDVCTELNKLASECTD